ncbi:C6 finger domain-containing protein [Colletotrichum kahawae]|uniref:C6 finger domain-containing protein n=1 Tax=Colletotrichum kahawae TaxID=34407 RepID=A0AAD9Y2V8_COLKA|nr:C6 finger domain-containing protein [Colletotrichum kahawae]
MESMKSSVGVVDGTWSHLNELISDVPCWTCRRRRLRCDNLKPACVKCTRAGLQCLGYGPNKPLVWVEHGRRRKMAHKQTPYPASPTPAPSVKDNDREWRKAPEDDDRQITRWEVAPIIKSPADPILRQHGIKSVEYICYYEQRCCMECSIYDEKSVNPFRRFLPMALSNPLVHHTIVSLAAHHRARSEQAITHMRLALAVPTPSDAVIASTLLLIWVELLESGYRSWKYHLGGMRALLLSRTSAALRSDVEAGVAGSMLHDATFWNFGAYFEEIYVSAGNRQEDVHACSSRLLQRLEQFSCRQWAVDYPEPNYVSQRESLAHAYKCAIEIYGRRALAGQHATELSHIAHAAVQSLRCISPRDCHFKGCQWPAFVAGAEARDPSDQMAVEQILLDMHKLVRTRNVEQAIHMLERVWHQSELPNPKTWIEYVYDTGEELLLV